MTQDYKTKYPIGSQWKWDDGNNVIMTIIAYTKSGTPVVECDDESVWSLSAEFDSPRMIEHKEPRTIEGWVNVYESDVKGNFFGDVHDSEGVAIKASSYMTPKLLKTIKISYTEGE